jgi:hypothetical protein
VGECWSSENSEDQTFEIFISPTLRDVVPVLGTLVHEACHAAVGLPDGHKGRFPKCATAIGLNKPMTATMPNEALIARLQEVAAVVGNYPHAKLNKSNAPKTQSCRLLLLKCPECGYLVRTTKKWLQVGLPTCPCGTGMGPGETGETDDAEG